MRPLHKSSCQRILNVAKITRYIVIATPNCDIGCEKLKYPVQHIYIPCSLNYTLMKIQYFVKIGLRNYCGPTRESIATLRISKI